MRGRRPPSAVSRRLRQEAGFGCAVCGAPFVEYHHIIEWAEKQHFDHDHMITLCPNHHRELSKLPKERAYSAKANPINIRKGRINGYLGGNRQQKALRLGAMIIEDCGSALNFCGNSIFSYRLIDGQYQLRVFLPDKHFWPEVEIVDNELSAFTMDFWDIEYKTNWVCFRRTKGNIFLKVDFRGEFVEIDGNIQLLGNEVSLSKSLNKFGSNSIAGRITNCAIGVRLGPSGQIVRPNYAMKYPKLIHIPGKLT